MPATLLFALTAIMTQKLGDADFPKPTPSERHTQKVAAVRSHNYDLLMIGDSITQTLGEMGGEWDALKPVWDVHFGSRNAINLGYSGYRTENTLWLLQNGELDCQKSPKVAVLLIGTNNTDDVNYPTVHAPEQIFAGTKAIVETIRQKHPTTKVLILKIFPRGGAKEVTDFHRRYKNTDRCVETCDKAGEMTKKLADGKHVFWLDVNRVFFRKDGSVNTDLMPDLVHPNAAGAEAWASALEPTLARLMGDKVRKAPQTLALEKAPKGVQELAGKRVMILGDSITQDGRWVSFFEYGLQKQYPLLDFNFFPVGLASETASGLTEPGHPFPRPDIHERLQRALKAVRPDVVMACYGMNDGIYMPFDEARFAAFCKGITSMVESCKTAGAKVILITPPPFVASMYGSNLTKKDEIPVYGKPFEGYDDVLAKYSAWEVRARPGGAKIVDLHSWMNVAIHTVGPASYDKGDGVHPNGFGHMTMAQLIANQLKLDRRGMGRDVGKGPLLDLIDACRRARSDGWLSYIGYTRGETVKTKEIVSTEDRVRESQEKIDKIRRE